MITIESSATTDKLDTAMAKAQGEFLEAAKNKVNPHFKSKYSDLTAVWNACRSSLNKHQIFVSQWPVHSDDASVHVITRIAHAGQWMQCRFSVPVSKKDAHGTGSALSYAKRYMLTAVLGLADEDDDGNEASKGKGPNFDKPLPPTTKKPLKDLGDFEIRSKRLTGKVKDFDVDTLVSFVASLEDELERDPSLIENKQFKATKDVVKAYIVKQSTGGKIYGEANT